MSERVSRRDFLKITSNVFAIAALPFDPNNLNLDIPEVVKKGFPLIFNKLGPQELKDYVSEKSSDGERTLCVDHTDVNKILIGTWENGLWKTLDFGNTWKQINIPAIQKEGYPQSVARDMLSIPGTNKILVVFDYSVSIGSLDDDSSWKQFKLPNEYWVTQTACILPDGKIVIGGRGWPFAGIAVMDPNSSGEWQGINGLVDNESGNFIRTITHSNGKILFGGWYGMENDGTQAGTGLIAIDDKYFKLIPSYTHKFEDDRGPMSVNTIKVVDYKGHEIVFVGGEGVGYKNKRRRNPNRSAMRILVDGTEMSQEMVNTKGLAITGGWDLITPQRGIIVCEETNEVFVSTGFKEISRLNLGNVIQAVEKNVKLDWERVTTPPDGQKDTGALHMTIGYRYKNGNKIPVLVVGRGIYGKGKLPFQSVLVADLMPEKSS